MRFLLYTYFILGLFFVFTSCAYKQDQLLFEHRGPNKDSTAIQKAFANIGNYRIKPQDILQIRNLQNSKNIVDLNPTISTALQGTIITQPEVFQVEDDGYVGLTGLGRVKVAGLTRVEALKLVEGLYRENYLKAPIIELKIINLKITVLGEARSQGNFTLTKDRTTLVEMIGEAGGLTEKADEKNIEIIRNSQVKPVVISIDLSNINSLTNPNTILQSGDIIYIAENKRAVRADKNQNLATLLQPGLLILSSAILIYSIFRR